MNIDMDSESPLRSFSYNTTLLHKLHLLPSTKSLYITIVMTVEDVQTTVHLHGADLRQFHLFGPSFTRTLWSSGDKFYSLPWCGDRLWLPMSYKNSWKTLDLDPPSATAAVAVLCSSSILLLIAVPSDSTIKRRTTLSTSPRLKTFWGPVGSSTAIFSSSTTYLQQRSHFQMRSMMPCTIRWNFR